MRFLVDAQLPPALARRIEALGHSAEHVADRGMTTASDNAIRDHAASVGAVIVTEDEDFAIPHLLVGGPSIVWLRVGNTRRAALLARMKLIFQRSWRRSKPDLTVVRGQRPAGIVQSSGFEHSRIRCQPDGSRFLVRANAAEAAAVPPVTVVINWQAGLKRPQ